MGEAGFSITVAGRPAHFFAQPGRSVLASLLAQGLDWLKVGCRSGGCGVCRIRVLQGAYDSLKMSRSRVSEAEEGAGIVLACRVVPKSDLRIERLPLATLR